MRALETDVVDAVWAAIEPLLPDIVDEHPLGCHRRRVPDRCSWMDTCAPSSISVVRPAGSVTTT